MKKTLVALAALAATASYAQVSITGIMDANYSSGNAYGQKYSLVNQNGARTTTFKFAGTEDMGGGLKANFQMEIQPLIIATDGNVTVNKAGFGNSATTAINGSQSGASTYYQSGLTGQGNTYIGLEGNFGEIRFGTNNSASLAAHSNGSGAFGTGVGSGYGFTIGSTSSNTFTRFETSVAYYTPKFNGVQGRYLTNFKNDAQYGSSTSGTTARRPAIQEFGIEYINGPLQLNAAQLQSKSSPNEPAGTTAYAPLVASNITTKYTTASASYDLKVARLGATYQSVVNDAGVVAVGGTAGALDQKATMLYAQVPMGQWRFLASTGSVKVNASPVAAAVGNKNSRTGLGVEYDLSKRTFLYARYEGGKAEAANAVTTVINGAAAGGSSAVGLSDATYNLTAVGVSHAF